MSKLIVFIVLVASFKAQITTSCEQCGNTTLVDGDAVCGSDGRTYLSECFALCSAVTVVRVGRCARQNCPQLYYPVCTASGRTYVNECEANFYNENIVAPGFCGVQVNNNFSQQYIPPHDHRVFFVANNHYSWP